MRKLSVNRAVWVFTTYFAEGLPYSLVAILPSIMFRDTGADLATIGFLSLLNIPWVIKFLWAPYVDSHSTLRKWICSTELAITAAMAMVTLSVLADNRSPVLLFLALGALFSATHDIAVDGFYMDALDAESQKKQIGFRVLAYRLALAAGSGIIVTIGTVYSWRCAYATATFFMLAIYIFHRFALPHPVREKKEAGSPVIPFRDAFVAYLKKRNLVHVLIFVIFMRAGEYLLGLMKGPMLVDMGIKVHIGWLSAGVSIPASILGAMAGGFVISKYTIERSGVPVIIFQNLTNLLYAWLAFNYAAGGPAHIVLPATAAVIGVESFSSGMGTALLMIVLMKLCDKEFKSSHYAIGSGLMALSGAIFNTFGGVVAQNIGYTWFYVISFAIAMPAAFVFRKTIDQPVKP